MNAAPPAAASTAEQVAELLAGGRVLAAQQFLRADPCDAATVQEVDAACEEVGTALRQLGRPGDDSAWRLALDNELLTFHKPPAEEEPHMHGVWFSGRLPAMTQHVVALAREFDLVQSFAGRFLFDTRVLGVESLLKLTVYSALWVPVLSDRDFAVCVRGYDCLDEHGCVVIAFNDDARFDAQLPQDRVRLRFKTSYLQLTPLPGNHTRATLVAHGTTNDELVISLCCRALTPILCLPVNPRMPGEVDVPATLINWALRIMCPFLFARASHVVASVCAHPQCLYRPRIAANPELYGLVAAREGAIRASHPVVEAPAAPADAVAESTGGVFSRLAAAWRGAGEASLAA